MRCITVSDAWLELPKPCQLKGHCLQAVEQLSSPVVPGVPGELTRGL